MLKVLLASSEAVPFSKSGGLGDVAGSLPVALKEKGADVRVIVPEHSGMKNELKSLLKHNRYIYVKVGWRSQYCGIDECEYRGVKFYFIDNQYYFDRGGLYGYYDEAERYVFFSRAVLEVLPQIGFCPDVIHCNDWQTAIIPLFLKANYKEYDFYKDIKTVYTIHNLQYQGVFDSSVLYELMNLDSYYYHTDRLEYNGGISFMKAGIIYSDFITTVSETYAEEIQYPYYGEGLNELIRSNRHKLKGILNGIDYHEFNPETDKLIYANYSLESLMLKKENKIRLQKELGLMVDADIPLFGIVSRLVSQKGVDLLLCVLNDILTDNVQLIVLGSGDDVYEKAFSEAASCRGERMAVKIAFSNSLAHKIYAGVDVLLMPSKFEPCGLAQMIALKYGTIPLVRETGGLKDTVTSFETEDESGNGFSFANYNAHDMLYTMRRAAGFYSDRRLWERLQKKGMNEDYSWERSAEKYIELYEKLKG